MNPEYPQPPSLHELESITRDYARFSRSAGGIAAVLGGLFCIVSYLSGGLLAPSNGLRVGLVALPLIWLLVKQGLARHYYQRFGHVEEQASRTERNVHGACVATVVVVAVACTLSVWSWPLPLGQAGYLALIWLLVPASWWYLRSVHDFIVGTFLFCQAALVCAGFSYPVIGTHAAAENIPMSLIALMFPLAALFMIRSGVADHRRFLVLREQLARLRGVGDPA